MRRSSILLVFFLSGASALIYQVAWMRKLALFLGTTSAAVSTVLAVFMGGLSLGAWLYGRKGDTTANPVRLYGYLELGIALLGISSAFWLGGLQHVHALMMRYWELPTALQMILRVLFVCMALLVPTTLMGATLPILLKGFHKTPGRLGLDAGSLYAANTLGAFVGTLAVVLLLIRTLGINGAIIAAAGGNFLAASVALLAGGKRPAEARPTPESTEERPDRARWVRGAFLACGFVGLAYEVLWTRYLIYVVRANSVYAFGSVLAACLLGIMLGSAVAALLIDRSSSPARVFGIVLILGGMAALFTPLGMNLLAPELIETRPFWIDNALMFAKSVTILLVPTALRGSLFAIAARACAHKEASIGNDVGRLYGANTLGAVAGALAGGFLILPHLGLRYGLILLASVDILVGVYALIRAKTRTRMGFVPLALGALMAYIVAINTPNPFSVLVGDDEKILFYRDGPESSIGVVKTAQGYVQLVIDGDVQASTDPETQLHLRMLGHLPAIFHPAPKRVMVVGFGAGITTDSLLSHPVEEVHIVELSKTVTDASVHFRKWNNNALSDRRVTLIHDDGRNYLLRTTNRYDIITTDPIDVDDAGTAGLYSREYYELVRSRLAPDGIACQWLMTRLSPDDFKTAVRTFLAVFPNCSVWNAKQSVVLVGMTAEKSITIGEYNAKCLQPGVREDLASVGIFSPDDLRAKVFAGPQQAADLVGDGVLITDNHPIVEYSRPRLDRLVLGGGNTNRPADPP